MRLSVILLLAAVLNLTAFSDIAFSSSTETKLETATVANNPCVLLNDEDADDGGCEGSDSQAE